MSWSKEFVLGAFDVSLRDLQSTICAAGVLGLLMQTFLYVA